MSKIVVLCEGDTEERAVLFFVARQWTEEGLAAVGLDRYNLGGKLEKVGRVAGNYLDEPDVLAVFTLVDLYGMTRVQQSQNDPLDAKVARVHNWLRSEVQWHRRADRFFPHVSVHEVEAWILAEGTALSRRLGDPGIQADPQAELKNFQNPPKRRLNELFRRSKKTRYRELLDGEPLFKQMSFATVYKSCQYFRKFYDDLKAAARE